MISSRTLQHAVIGFLRLVASSFLVQTWMTYGLDLSWSHSVWVVVREIVWFGGLGLLAIISYRTCWERIRSSRWLLVVLLLLMGWGIGHSLWLGETRYQLLIGFKYDIYPLLLLLSATWLGYRRSTHGEAADLSSFHRRYGYLVISVLVVGWLWQLAKLLVPDLFLLYLGYGGFGDFMPGEAPPIYYLTGSGGIPRLSGLFAGPNVLGFFLVLLASYRDVVVSVFRRRWLAILRTGLYILSLYATLSRGAMVAFGLHIIAAIWILWSVQLRRMLLYTVFVVAVTWFYVGLVQEWKTGSTQTHGNARSTAREAIDDNPRGYGLGMSGPAQHYAPDYQERPQHDLSMVESVYIQRIVNMGWIGLGLIIVFFLVWFGRVRVLLGPRSQRGEWRGVAPYFSQIVLLFSIGLGALLVEGLVLHVFIDSMINYLFFVPYGVTVGRISRKRLSQIE